MAEISVYFNSGHKAKLDADIVILAERCPDISAVVDTDCVVVNWANVSFIRRSREPGEDEEGAGEG